MLVQLTPDSLEGQVEEEDDDEVEDDQSVHLLANFGLGARILVLVSPVESDHEQHGQDENTGQDQSDVQTNPGILLTNLEIMINSFLLPSFLRISPWWMLEAKEPRQQ